MFDLGFALFLALVSAGLGWRILRWLGGSPEHPVDVFGLALPLGMGLLALASLVLGQFRGLNIVGLAVLVGVVTELGLFSGFRLVRELARSADFGSAWKAARVDDRVMGVFLIATVAATALTSLTPVTDGDALCYHLQVPKVFLIQESVFFDPDLHETVYPLTAEMLYMVALAFRGPIACRCIQWMLGLALAANATALARPSLGGRAWWAGMAALLVPAVTNGMTAPLNDVALAAFGTAAIVAWVRLLDNPARKAAILAGVFAGLAAGVKYPALVLAALLVTGIVLRPLYERRRVAELGWSKSLRLAAWFAFAAAAAGGAWYLRAYVYTGNPVFPFFRSWFGSGLEEVLAPIKRPLPVTLWNIVTSIGPLTLEPHRFDSFAHQFGPIFLLFLPALLLEKAPRRVLGLVLLGYGFLMVCMTQRQSMRFLLIAVGPLSVGVAYLAATWRERQTIPARVLATLLIAVLGLETCVAMTRAGRSVGTVLGRESSVQFLARCEPTFKVGRWVSEHLPRTARLIGQDHRGFYIPRNYTMELAHRRRTGLGANGESDREIIDALRRDGYTHLMLCPPKPDGEVEVEFDPTLCKLLAPWLALHRPLYKEDLGDSDGLVRSYAIYDLEVADLGVVRTEGVIR
ncbi:MAG: 4-amino-4-deoxy-L-arabinose transferase [Paludisphaera borealis]|uniref:ArnT family glycosyltransferase n=1 Tax=Paludisphaera borealis TaxID=1387353 RepID=UPI00284FB218|nr:4-amino-4-deoxy-L-arabinose transferase [Paludisphaera borealis]MDR3620881.1 4-amino-4-deoxy-L-arabinose transferase [Paludisphaera borealis]